MTCESEQEPTIKELIFQPRSWCEVDGAGCPTPAMAHAVGLRCLPLSLLLGLLWLPVPRRAEQREARARRGSLDRWVTGVRVFRI